MKAVILVGGSSRGTRFRPLSLNLPKPLFPIAGKPMIYHHVSALARLQAMKEILIIGFFEPAHFSSFLAEVAIEFPNVQVRYLREYQSLGTGGGLYHFRDQILRGLDDKFFVMHADVCSTFPLSSILDFHVKHEGTCTLLGTKVPKDTATRYGCLVSDPKTQEVLHYVEKPETFVSDLISCGVYLFDKAIFKQMEQTVQSHHEKGMRDILRLEQDILRPMASTKQLYVYETRDFWRQIKTAGTALPANKLYMLQYHKVAPEWLVPQRKENESSKAGPVVIGDVTIHPMATVHPSARLGPNVSIGKGVVIGKGVCVRESIILDGVDIKDYSCVIYSIVGWNSKIGQWCRIEGTPPQSDSQNISAAANICDVVGTVNTFPVTDLMLPSGVKNQSVTILGEAVTVADEQIIRNCIVLPHKELRSSYTNDILM